MNIFNIFNTIDETNDNIDKISNCEKLCIACKTGDLDTVLSMLEMETNPEGEPVENAIINGDQRILHALFYEAGASRKKEYIILAAKCHNLDIFKYLYKGYHCADHRDMISICGYSLIEATKNGNLNMIKLIISLFERNLKVFTYLNCAAFCIACENGHLEIVKYLLDAIKQFPGGNKIGFHQEPSVNIANIRNGEPLRLSFKNGHKEVAIFLMNNGAKPRKDDTFF